MRKNRRKVKCSRMTHLQMGEEIPSHISKESNNTNSMQIVFIFFQAKLKKATLFIENRVKDNK